MVTVLIMFIIVLFIDEYDRPYKRGFYCNDNSIFKPYYPVIIPYNYVFTFATSVATISILLIEFQLNNITNIRRLLLNLNHFHFGLMLSILFALTCKNVSGRLRPNSIIGRLFNSNPPHPKFNRICAFFLFRSL